MTSYSFFFSYIPFIVEGALWTICLVGGGLGLGFLIGVPAALSQVYGGRKLRCMVELYLRFFREVPLLVQLFLFYWGLFPSIGLKLDPLRTSILVLGLRSGAYQSQIFRSAIESVERGQLLAAMSIGMSRSQALLYVILPQAFRISIPGWANEYAVILKDSAICFSLGVMEILTKTRYVTIATGMALLPYLFAGILFILLTNLGTGILNMIYKKFRIPGLIGV
ncbi:MAG: amino acid ABC transporter permease [Candidatus Methanodesulfokora sp.]|jgi:polar amino acid transport system permease protein